MTIKVQHGDVFYIVDTPEEAVRIGTLLNRGNTESLNDSGAGIEICAAADKAYETETVWTPELFHTFIGRLGKSQWTALSVIIARRHVSDEYLRKVVGVADNQALAGVLSGISKQATALGIPARAVFSFDNLRKTGKRQSIYNVSPSFHKFATELDSTLGENKL